MKTPQQGLAAHYLPKLQAHGSDGQSGLPALRPMQGDQPFPCAQGMGLSVLTCESPMHTRSPYIWGSSALVWGPCHSDWHQ